MSGKVKRKTVMAREDLANRLIEISKKQGRTLYDLVNMIFELAVKAESEGLNLESLIEESRILKNARKSCMIIGFEGLWYDMAEIAYKKSPEETVKRWVEAGEWLAKRYIYEDKPMESLLNILKAAAWETPEYKIESEEGKVKIQILNMRYPETYAHLYACLIEGILETYGYKTVEKTVSTGKIWIRAEKA